jgi:hypothetical protein
MAAPLSRPGGRRLLPVALALVVLTLATTACGAGSPKAGVASLGTTTTVVATGGPSSKGYLPAELVKYATCMRSHGILSFPDPVTLEVPGDQAVKVVIPESVASSPKFQAARQACAKYAPPKISPPQITTQDQADYLKAATCMRNHGIVGFPDPVFAGGQVRFPIPNGMDTNSTPFLRAREICEMLIPAGLPYSKEAEGGQ